MLRNIKTGMLALSICYIVVGLLLLVAPNASLPWLCAGFSAVVLATGAYSLVRYFKLCGQGARALGLMVGGVVTTALGLFALLRPTYVEWVLPVVLGLFVVVDGAMRGQSALQLRKRSGQKWWVVLLLGAVSGLLGFGLLCASFFESLKLDLILLCGIILVGEGILNMACVIYTAMELHALDRLEAARAAQAATPYQQAPEFEPLSDAPAPAAAPDEAQPGHELTVDTPKMSVPETPETQQSTV